MIRRVTRTLAALLLGSLLAFGAAAQEGQPCPQPGTQQEFPLTLGPGFQREGTHSFEADMPGGGCSVSYKHPGGMTVTVYVYQAKLGQVDDLPRDPRLLEEFKNAMTGITLNWQQKYQATVRDTVTRYETRGARNVEVMVGWAGIDLPKVPPLRTHLLLWSGSGVIWKLRVTFPEADKAVSDAAVTGLGDALVDLSREKQP